MKLEKLTIHNIASIEDAEIDFTSDPLADEPVFLICGPTGSGKSTILDCICLALYNRVPRLENAPNEKCTDRLLSGSKEDAADVSINDPRMLLRRGSVACSVVLTFLDNNNVRYTAAWSCRHAYNRLDRKVGDVEWVLTPASGTPLTKKREVATAIERIVGLNFEQFRRTTLLAQGEFSRFLSSDTDSKSEILEKLTGTSVYSQIGKRIAERHSALKRDFETKEAALGSIRLMSADELDALDKRLTEIDTLSRTNSEAQTACSRLIAAIVALNAADAEITELTDALSEANARTATPEFKALADDIALWERTETLRGAMDSVDRLTGEHKRQSESAADPTTFADALRSVVALEQAHNRSVAETAELSADYARLDSLSEVLRNKDLIVSEAKTFAANSRSISDSGAKIKGIDKRIASTTEKITLIEAKAGRLAELLDLSQNLLAETGKSAEANSLDSAREADSTAGTRLDALRRAERLLHEFGLRTDAERNASTDIEECLRRHTDATAEAERLTNAYDAAAEALAAARTIYERQKETTADYLKELRSTLSEGQDCPLCGQRIERLTSTEQFTSLLRPLKDDLDAKEAAEKVAAKALNEAKANVKALDNNLATLRRNHKKAAAEAAKALGAAKADPTAATYLTPEAAIDSQRLTDDLRQAEAAKEATSRRFSQATSLSDALRRLMSECDRLKSDKGVLDNDIRQLNLTRSDLASQAAVLKAGIDSSSGANRTIADNCLRLIANVSGRQVERWRKLINDERLDSLAADVRTVAAEWDNLRRRLETSTNRDKDVGTALGGIRETIGEIARRRPSWPGQADVEAAAGKADPTTTASRLNGIKDQVVAADASLETLRRQLAASSKLLAEESAAFDDATIARLKEMASEGFRVADRRKERDSALEAVKTLETKLGEARKRREKADADLGDTPHEGLEAERGRLETLAEEGRRLMTEKGSIDQRLESDSQSRKRHAEEIKKLDSARSELEKWNRLNALFGSADGKRMRNIAQSWVLEQLVVGANHYLRQLSPRYELGTQPGRLTLLVRDRENEGDMRPAVNLSGGESFVVSLALALGLPSLCGSVMGMDVIFIDEGFGTLDAEVRTVVVDMLERLHNIGGQRVGLISHVDSLRERIPVKIEVSPRSSAMSEIRIYRSE